MTDEKLLKVKERESDKQTADDQRTVEAFECLAPPTDTGSDAVMETLRRIEADVAELKARLPAS